jgi:anti-sigma factor RsiW
MSSLANNSLTNPACAELRLWLPELADGQPLPPEAAHLAAHLPSCPACQAELAELRQLFNDLDALPPELPPLGMRDDFQAMLEQEKAKLSAASPAGLKAQRGGQPLATPVQEQASTSQKSVFNQQWLRVAASVALVAVGAILGLLLRGGQPAAPLAQADQPASPTLSARLAAARQQPATASQRLQLVSQAPAAVVEPNDPAVLTLIHTLDTDPNPNVRLAACEALFRLRSDPRVGPALVEALPLQTDPNVQITLIETLVTLREKRAVPQLEELAKKPEVLRAVRLQAENGVGQLI